MTPERYAFRVRKFIEANKHLAWDALVKLIVDVAADEREECAKVAESGLLNAESIAAAIRARGGASEAGEADDDSL
jgi:hypothetical protein